jgi:hypothetical protein
VSLSLLETLFGWPDGITTGNLIASLLWVPLSLAGTWAVSSAHHKSLHGRIDQLEARMARNDKEPGMTTAYMWDDVVPSLIPADAQIIAYYKDGRYANFAAIAKLFPHAILVGIAVREADDADVLDVEPGDASIADIFYWLKRQLAIAGPRPVSAPVIYISASDVDSMMVHMDANGFVHGKDYLIWSAHWTGSPHVCGPATCKATSTACDATQYTNHADGKNLDESLLTAQFLHAAAGPKPVPTPTVTLDINGTHIVLETGKSYTLSVS